VNDPQSLPPEDRTLSPYTGYSRAHWRDIAERLTLGVARCTDPDAGVPDLPTDPEETALPRQLRNPGGPCETFDRTFLLVALYIAATGRTKVTGCDIDLADSYRRGIAQWIDPTRPGHNPYRFGMAAVLAMLLVPQHFVDLLDGHTKDLLRAYLPKLITRPCSESNLMLFSMMPAPLMDRLEIPYDRALLDGYFTAILSLYRGDGWFIDGWNRGFDHYNFWGFQLYLHALMHFDPRWREQYAQRVLEITRLHEESLPYFFGPDGAPIPKGRSLNYRFAAVSGIGFSQLSGLSTLDPGLARRISSGCLKYFWDHGCQSPRGALERGYRGVNSAVGEDYTDRGAPYWAATGLVALALPESHPFWTAPEKPLAADTPGIKRCPVPGAQMVLKADPERSDTRLLNVGEPFYHRHVWQAGSKYYQHAYSSSLGYALAGDQGPELAAGRTGISSDGRQWAWRVWPRVLHLDAFRARSAWDAWPSLQGLTGTVVTESFFLDHGEIHVFWHTDPAPRYLALGGWSVQIPHDQRAQAQPHDRGLVITSDLMWSALHVVGDVPGDIVMEEVRPRPGFRHAHIFEGWAAFPRWTSREPVPRETPIAIFVDAARCRETPQPSWPAMRLLAQDHGAIIEVDGHRIEISTSS
jgi:hypothetical protein